MMLATSPAYHTTHNLQEKIAQCLIIKSTAHFEYRIHVNAALRPEVLFFNMGFWVGVNSKNPLKSGLFDQKVGVYSLKTPKTGLFTLPGALFKSGLH